MKAGPSASQQKPKPNKKVTYSSPGPLKTPCGQPNNEFELIYKFKNRENDNHEDSFESIILLKSKNRVKRTIEDKGKPREQEGLRDVLNKINQKIHEHSRKATPRLINLFGINSKSPRSLGIPDPKISTYRAKGPSKLNKEDHQRITNRMSTTKSQKTLRKTKRTLEVHSYQNKPEDEPSEYILFQNQIHPILQETDKNLVCLMKSTYFKSGDSLDGAVKSQVGRQWGDQSRNTQGKEEENYAEEEQQQSQESGQDQEQQESDSSFEYYCEKAVTIQRVWRGYISRKRSTTAKKQHNRHSSIPQVDDLNNHLIKMFQQIINTSSFETKNNIFEEFTQVMERVDNGRVSKVEGRSVGVVEAREDAVQEQFQLQNRILEQLLVSSIINTEEYTEKIQELTSWATLKKEDIDKLKQIRRDMEAQTQSIVADTRESARILGEVTKDKCSPCILLKHFERIEKQVLNVSFFEAQPVRESALAHHNQFQQSPPPPQSSSDLKTLVEELQQKQRIKPQVQRRILQQLGYVFEHNDPVNTSNIGVHNFLNDILEFVEEYHKEEFLRWINMPYGYSPEYRLKLLQGYDSNVSEEHYGMSEGVESVLSLEILLEYHKQVYTQSQEDLYNIYHERAIFDAFNEALNVFRPYYAIRGPPYLWNYSEKALTFYYISDENIDEVFEKTKNQVIRHTSSLCGLLCHQPKRACLMEELSQLKLPCNNIADECREQKLSHSEKQQLILEDSSWLLVEQEKAHIMLNLSELVVAQILTEWALEMQAMQETQETG